MYNGIKSCVRYKNDESGYFPCLVGVRQGENLSPFLFSIFLNDLDDYFRDLNGSPLRLVAQKCQDTLQIYLEIFALLYADDTVIFAESTEKLQSALDIFDMYCKAWKLSINTNKTKVMIFSKRKTRQHFEFKLNDASLDIVDNYTYLGLLMKYNGTFNDAKVKLVDQAQKALFALYTKIRNLNIPLDIQLQLFDSLIEPILLYGSEVWGFENSAIVERVHLQFCKRILGVRKSTPNFMVYGELGRFPLDINIKLRMISFFNRIMKNENKLSSVMFKLMYQLQQDGIGTFKWVTSVQNIFDNCGLSYIFFNQQYIDFSLFKPLIKQTLQDQFIQNWFSSIENSSRGNFYGSLKKQFELEKYLLRLPEKYRIWISKIRTCNINIPIETGRWNNIPREERICTLCDSELLGDEFHYLYICKNENISTLRRKLIPNYYTVTPSIHKMEYMLSLCHKQLLSNVAIFVKNICVFM